MPMQWPTYEKQPISESNAVGNAIDVMVAQQRAQSEANMRQLQAARAADAKRIRQEDIDAAKVLNSERR